MLVKESVLDEKAKVTKEIEEEKLKLDESKKVKKWFIYEMKNHFLNFFR